MSMKPLFTITFALALALSRPYAAAGEPELVSSMGLAAGVESIGGITVVPVTDIPGRIYTEDLAPSQVFEVIRPQMQAVSVGRLLTSCVCVRATMEKKSFAAGERAIIEVRNVKATPAAGARYAFFVQITSPYQTTLQHDFFMKSGFDGATTVQAQPHYQYQVQPEIIQPTAASTTPTAAPVYSYEQIAPYTTRAAE